MIGLRHFVSIESGTTDGAYCFGRIMVIHFQTQGKAAKVRINLRITKPARKAAPTINRVADHAAKDKSRKATWKT